MLLISEEDVCPQCGGTNVDICIDPSDKHAVMQCLSCGCVCEQTVQEDASVNTRVSPGYGAYVIVSGDNAAAGRLKMPWHAKHQRFFENIFKSGNVDFGFVTRWNFHKRKLDTAYEIKEGAESSYAVA